MTNTERLAGLTDAELASEVERLQILGPRQVVQVLAAAMARLRRPAPNALLDEAARQALLDTAEGVLWLRRAVLALAERHGVKLPPAPRPPRRPT